jgi:hypothetical protein
VAVSEPVPEAALAALLADVLADRGFWSEYEGAASRESAPAIARRAARLYLATGAFIQENRHLDPAGQVAKAVAALREIADWAALASYASAYRSEEAVIPTRAAFEWLIRLDRVDDWAADLGYRIPIADGELPEDLWPKEEPDDAEVGDFLNLWATFSQAYEKLVDPSLQKSWPRLVAKGGPSIEQLRESTADLIYGARASLVWAHGNLPVAVQPLAVAGVLVMETMFAATCEWPEDGVIPPDPGVISELLRESDALDWLVEQGSEIPPWLT